MPHLDTHEAVHGEDGFTAYVERVRTELGHAEADAALLSEPDVLEFLREEARSTTHPAHVADWLLQRRFH
jgi:hypothetical protein